MHRFYDHAYNQGAEGKMLINLKEKNIARGQLLSELIEWLQQCNLQTVDPARLLSTVLSPRLPRSALTAVREKLNSNNNFLGLEAGQSKGLPAMRLQTGWGCRLCLTMNCVLLFANTLGTCIRIWNSVPSPSPHSPGPEITGGRGKRGDAVMMMRLHLCQSEICFA